MNDHTPSDHAQPHWQPLAPLRELREGFETHIDPVGVFTPLLHAYAAWMLHPQELGQAWSELSTRLCRLQDHSIRRVLGAPSPDVEKPNPDDTRFADPVWTESATWDIVKEWYLSLTHHTQDALFETPGLSSRDRRRAAFWWRKWLNAMAPTNFLWTNPVAQRLAAETNGESLRKGWQNLLEDMRSGTIRMSRTDTFTVGGNLATTPGKVVLRNRLLELIHYAPTQAQVHAVPMLLITPWINKFYVLDLSEKKSLVKYLLDQGHDVYITSWKNPDAEMRDVTFDDYVVEGIDQAVQVVQSLSGSATVNLTGYCVGGAALAVYLAWASRHYPAEKSPVAAATFFTTLVDYHKPGDIEVFLDPNTVNWLCGEMEKKGYLDGAQMASSFRLLRSNSLIWNYVVSGYLYGEPLSAFDVLYWNMDTTRIPAATHSWYLREFYLNNRLIEKNGLTVGGEAIDLGRITQPAYVVTAEDDHIVPWRQSFKLINHLAGPRRFVRSSSGHILGIVNPPVNPPKREYLAGDAERHDTVETWQERAESHRGSWWQDWMAWIGPQSGPLRKAPPVSNRKFPALADAPGSYVLEQ